MEGSPDPRSPLAVAMEWSSRVTGIALEMVLPALVGFWLDQRLGTRMVFLMLGAAVGFAAGMWQLIKLAKSPPGKGGNRQGSSQKD
jgi:F0F1-type ATP synthase assembly protein I